MKRKNHGPVQPVLLGLVFLGFSNASICAAELSEKAVTSQEEFQEVETIILEEEPTFETREILVTAQRYKTRELDTPAAVDILTEEDLINTGGRNIADALRFSPGIIYSTYGPGSASMSSMTSKTIIRGVDSGTLVMVNGIPVNMRDLYRLEQIPVNSVERVEIVRGGGSVLYGSQATGGVINVITKDKFSNQAVVELGSKGQQNYNINLQEGPVGITYSYSKYGSVDRIGLSTRQKIVDANPTGRYNYMDFDGSERNQVGFNYKIDDHWKFLYTYQEDISYYTYRFYSGTFAGKPLKDKIRYTRKYKNMNHLAQLTYENKGWKTTAFLNKHNMETTGEDFLSSTGSSSGYPKYTDSEEKNRTLGLDTQYQWNAGNERFLVGGTGYNEYYREKGSGSYERELYSLYASWEHPFGDSTTLILSGRESWTRGAPDDRNYDKFTPQVQLIHQLNDNDNIYASYSESYKMPTFKQIYGSTDGRIRGNPNVEPQSGKHYEIGWKRNKGDQSWRAAIFHYFIEDNITSQAISPGSFDYKYSNEDLKNTGLEVSWGWDPKGPWRFSLDASFGNPKSRTTNKPYWDRVYGRFQVGGTIGYEMKKWQADLSFGYLADRVMTPSSSESDYVKPYLLTNLNVKYHPSERKEIYLAIENIFDRKDIVSHTSSEYYSTPINFRVGYRVKF